MLLDHRARSTDIEIQIWSPSRRARSEAEHDQKPRAHTRRCYASTLLSLWVSLVQSPAFRSAHSQWTVILRQHFCLESGDHSWSLGRWEGRTPLPNVVWDILMAGAGEASATDSLVVVSLPPTSQRHGNAFKRDVACERYFRIRVKCISQKISN